MRRRTTLALFVGLPAVAIGLAIYEYHRLDLPTMPPVPEGSFWMAFKTGSRLIISGVADERSTRTFFVQRNTEVPAYFAGAWSHRSPPNADEAAHIQQSMPTTPGARLEAVCTIEADGEVILTDLLYSAPKL